MNALELSEKDRDFIRKRARLLKCWPWVAGALLLSILGLALWLWWRTPLLANPLAVTRELRDGRIEESTLIIMAAILPLMTLLSLLLTALIVVFHTAAFMIESRHLRIIARLGTPAGK